MKTSITIVGACISNWVVWIQASLKESLFLTKGCAEGVSQLALATEPIPELVSQNQLWDRAKYELAKNSLKFAIEKNIEEFARGKYILLDFLSSYRKVLSLEKDGQEWLLGSVEEFETRIPGVISEIREMALKYGYQVKTLAPLNGDIQEEKVERLIREYAIKIKKKYDGNHIILNAAYPSYDEAMNDGIAVGKYKYPEIENQEKWLRKVYKYFVKEVPDCFVVNIPDYMIADPGAFHQMPRPFHFHLSYYEYILRAIDIITDGDEKSKTQKRLDELRNIFSNKVLQVRLELMRKSCVRLQAFAYENDKRKIQVSTTKEFLDTVGQIYNLDIKGKIKDSPKNLNEYIEYLKKERKNCILMMSVRDSANTYWDRFTYRNELGLTVNLSKGWRRSYCAIVDINTGHAIEKFDDSARELFLIHNVYMLEHSNSVYSGSGKQMQLPTSISIMLISKARENEIYKSKILINNIDYSMDMIGMNFVVYSLEDQCVIDSFNVDFWSDSELKINRYKTKW